jgi:porin
MSSLKVLTAAPWFARLWINLAVVLAAIASGPLSGQEPEAEIQRPAEPIVRRAALEQAKIQQRPGVQLPHREELEPSDESWSGFRFLEWNHATDGWWGLRRRLHESGLTLNSTLTIDGSRSFQGGANPDTGVIRNLFDLNLTLSTEPAFGWAGGTFFIDFQNHSGPQGSAIVGDAQGFSNIDADGRTQVSQLWFEQTFLDGDLRLKIGKVDANSEFAYVEHGGEFLNSSMGFSPTIFVFPSYPDPAFSVNLIWDRPQGVYWGCGIYDGVGQRGVPTGSRGPSMLLAGTTELFFVTEAGFRWRVADLVGRAGAGSWYHNAEFKRFTGGTQDGTGGVFLVCDQEIWARELDDKERHVLGLFVQYGFADRNVSPFAHHFGTGLVRTGPLPHRNLDVCGLGVTAVVLSTLVPNVDEDYELAVESFYKLQLLKWFSLKFDLQYIHNVGGKSAIPDALVGTIRGMIDF